MAMQRAGTYTSKRLFTLLKGFLIPDDSCLTKSLVLDEVSVLEPLNCSQRMRSVYYQGVGVVTCNKVNNIIKTQSQNIEYQVYNIEFIIYYFLVMVMV